MNIIQWRNESDLSEGFILDMENLSAHDLIQFYSRANEHISNFTDAFLMMGLDIHLAEEAARETYTKARTSLNNIIDKYRDMPVNYLPASQSPLQ
ncbi:hypothetical protein [Pantoea sp. C8B4]|uniref:hypothetical protein n=1 Tax=Pantoea sp. C8B4 TaxID=3243083 RepID=UPI00073F989B|nr:hypothetical protein [Type-E symbiont of Plautia stali]